MKTLNEIPPTWSQSLPANDGDPNGCGSSRFDCVLGGAALLDKGTGLVCGRAHSVPGADWANAAQLCYFTNTGGRPGACP